MGDDDNIPMDSIQYDILENIIIYLKIDDIINFLMSSKGIYITYRKNDENYGCNKIANRIIKECALFFKINDKINYNSEDKRLLTTNFIKIYNVYKNNKLYNNSDLLVYIMENNIKSNELFRCLCLKSKFCENMERCKKRENVVTYNNCNNLFFRNFDKNIISNSDMKYMIVNVDKCKLEIILNSFHIKSETIAYCINELLKYKNEDYDVKIKICIDYIFFRYCFKKISQYDKIYFMHIFICFILHILKTSDLKTSDLKNNKNLLKYFINKMRKYSKFDILNIDYITQIIYKSKYSGYDQNYYYLFNMYIKNYVNCLINF